MLTLNLRLGAFTRVPRFADEPVEIASRFLGSPFEPLRSWHIADGFSVSQGGDSNPHPNALANAFDRVLCDKRSQTSDLHLTPSTAGDDGDDLLRIHLKSFFTANGLAQIAADWGVAFEDRSAASRVPPSADDVRRAEIGIGQSLDAAEVLCEPGPD